MALSQPAKIARRGTLARAGHYEEGEITTKLDVTNVVHQKENIYLDVFQINKTNIPIKASYSKTVNIPILDRPSDFKCYLQRLQLRSGGISMFRNREYNLGFSLYYFPDNLTVSRIALKTLYSDDYNFFSQYFILNNPDGINENIRGAFADLVTQYEVIHGPGSWVVDANPRYPPWIAFNDATGFFEVYNDVASVDGNIKAVQLYLNEELYLLIAGLPLDYPVVNTYGFNSLTLAPPLNAKVTFNLSSAASNLVTMPDGGDYVKIIQGYQTLSRWWVSKGLMVVSDTLNIRSHFLMPSTITTDASYRNIIQYIPIEYSNVRNYPPGNWITFTSTSENAYSDILGDAPLKNIRFDLYFTDVFGDLYPVELFYNDSFEMTIGFVKNV